MRLFKGKRAADGYLPTLQPRRGYDPSVDPIHPICVDLLFLFSDIYYDEFYFVDEY
jgi:hypothetical protein